MNIHDLMLPITLVVFFISIVLHEIAHGWAASLCGDLTARQAGRLSLWPPRHMDLIGSVLVPLILFLSGATVFGWAKPVPVNFKQLYCRQRLIVVGAGPLMNFAMAVIGLGLFFITKNYMVAETSIWVQALCIGGFVFFPVNLLLCLFNTIPLPPLDGWVFLSTLFKKDPTETMRRPWVLPVSLCAAITLIREFSGYLNDFVRYFVGVGLS
jgi:Zn-dependent protease